MSIPAIDIHNDLLERTGTALDTGDFGQFVECFLFPNVIESFDGKLTVETSQDMREVFNHIREFRALNNVTSVVRSSLSAEYVTETEIHATHQSCILSRDIIIQPTYPVYSVHRRIDGKWKIGFSQYAIKNTAGLDQAITGPARNKHNERSPNRSKEE